MTSLRTLRHAVRRDVPRRVVARAAYALAALALVSGSAATIASAQTGGMAAMGAGTAKQPPASPRDSLATTIAGSNITVNYGRPSKRGRVLFNGLADMKWGTVWRTGANEATHITTSKTLAFGNKLVPPGRYTLYTHLVEDGAWELIVNKQVGQWGTEYNAAQDVVRIPLTVTKTNPITEKMEITVTPASSGGEIAIKWDTYKAVAPFTVK